MYINFDLLESKGHTYGELLCLQYLKQLRSEKMAHKFDERIIEIVDGYGYVDRLKDGNPRLSKKGAELLDLIQTPNANENHVAMAEYLIEKYKEDSDKILCSKNKLVELIAWFCAETSMTARELYNTLLEYWKTDDSKFNKKLDYLFFKPEGAYSKRTLNSSRLYIWMENNKH